jgi:hypothetical protein
MLKQLHIGMIEVEMANAVVCKLSPLERGLSPLPWDSLFQ